MKAKRLLLMIYVALICVGNVFANETATVTFATPVHYIEIWEYNKPDLQQSPITKENIVFTFDDYSRNFVHKGGAKSYYYFHYSLCKRINSGREDINPDKTSTISVADESTGCKITKIEFKCYKTKYVTDDNWTEQIRGIGDVICSGKTSESIETTEENNYLSLVHTVNFGSGVTSTTVSINPKFDTDYSFSCDEIVVYCEYPNHTHNYGNAWLSDADYHWHDCTSNYGLCHDRQGSKAAHLYGETGASYYTCQTCGYVNEDRKHVHNYSQSWTYDDTQHWHACTSNIGTCSAPMENPASHEYGANFQDGEAYYTCETCGYVNNTRKEQYNFYEYKLDKIASLRLLGEGKSNAVNTIVEQYVTSINSADNQANVDNAYQDGVAAVELQLYKEAKIAALQTMADGIASASITEKVQAGTVSINQATSKSNVDTAYNNAASALQALIAVYNDGKNIFAPTTPGMRLRVKTKEGKTYEFETTNLEKVDYYRAR